MSFKIGNKVKLKPILGGINVYKIITVDFHLKCCHIESDLGNNCIASRKVSFVDMLSNYIKVDMYGNPIKEDGDQLSWYDGFLVPGKENKEEKYCNHDWKVYTGLNFSDEYCTKCNKKREIEKK